MRSTRRQISPASQPLSPGGRPAAWSPHVSAADVAASLAQVVPGARATGDWSNVDALIDQARELKMTWAQIGQQLGVSGQAAWTGRRRRMPTLDVNGVADLQLELTGFRPAAATIRSYHSRGFMPAQLTRGRWAEPEIRRWLAARRPRQDAPLLLEQVAQQLTELATPGRVPEDPAVLDAAVAQARALRLTWAQIGELTGVSAQAAWSRHRRRTTRGDGRSS